MTGDRLPRESVLHNGRHHLSLKPMTDRLVQLVLSCQRAPDFQRCWDLVLVILEEFRPSLRKFILRVSPASAAEDILQETVMAMATGLIKFRGESDSQLKSWCFRIAHHKIANYFRETGRQETWDPEHLETLLGTDPMSEKDRRDLKDALLLLGGVKPPCVAYLWTSYVVDLSFAEMAGIFGGTPDSVRMQTSRCLALKQAHLGRAKFH